MTKPLPLGEYTKLGGEKGRRDFCSRGRRPGRRRHEPCRHLLQLDEEPLRWRLRRGEKLTREAEGRAVKHLGGRDPRILLGGSPKAQQNPRQVIHPIRTAQPSPETVFKLVM
jgi:hypothetical protein